LRLTLAHHQRLVGAPAHGRAIFAAVVDIRAAVAADVDLGASGNLGARLVAGRSRVGGRARAAVGTTASCFHADPVYIRRRLLLFLGKVVRAYVAYEFVYLHLAPPIRSLLHNTQLAPAPLHALIINSGSTEHLRG